MSASICLRCRASLRAASAACRYQQTRRYTSKPILETEADIDEFLSRPSWSVRSLLPTNSDAPSTPSVTSEQLSHLLRLSALPQPTSDPILEEKMMATLESQLHFVREMQKVDTTDVEPLQAIREETEEGLEEHKIGLDRLRDALAKEEVRGRMKRPRRKELPSEESRAEWNPLATASRTVGDYFVVKTEGKS